MKKILIPSLILLILVSSCKKERRIDTVIDEALAFSLDQYTLMYDVMKDKPEMLPRTINTEGELVTVKSSWWTSGFFPGSLWYLYEYSDSKNMLEAAKLMSDRVEREKFTTNNHDVGFMIGCSFGNGLRLTGVERYKEIIVTAAKSLSTRFRPNIGLIQSWSSRPGWQCPVIIDNMMNLELLMEAFRLTGDSSFYKIAVSHADMTMKYHFRPDYSSYHVVSFDTITGNVEVKQTHQGYADESAWARGQSWGLYGYTVMYRETKLDRYLRQAENIADFLINHPNMPEDKIPYWDYNAPDIPDAKRDASAGAIMASALIELSGFVDDLKGKEYQQIAERQIRTLSSPAYLAKKGENRNFILMHSVGHLPGNSEVDVPLSYADYYYIESMIRFRGFKN
ncbi:MAG TPA: glycoside hydrolase family 88 protein [Bacteroidales bacterium]|nr:glycoside hydrolase family 88 protein [Bacteroidales bacterium]